MNKLITGSALLSLCSLSAALTPAFAQTTNNVFRSGGFYAVPDTSITTVSNSNNGQQYPETDIDGDTGFGGFWGWQFGEQNNVFIKMEGYGTNYEGATAGSTGTQTRLEFSVIELGVGAGYIFQPSDHINLYVGGAAKQIIFDYDERSTSSRSSTSESSVGFHPFVGINAKLGTAVNLYAQADLAASGERDGLGYIAGGQFNIGRVFSVFAHAYGHSYEFAADRNSSLSFAREITVDEEGVMLGIKFNRN